MAWLATIPRHDAVRRLARTYDAMAETLDTRAVQAATGIVAMFNHLTRVADASGIEFDYAPPLPACQPERDSRAASLSATA